MQESIQPYIERILTNLRRYQKEDKWKIATVGMFLVDPPQYTWMVQQYVSRYHRLPETWVWGNITSFNMTAVHSDLLEDVVLIRCEQVTIKEFNKEAQRYANSIR